MIRSIVVVEPMCRGFEHVQFNAPLLRTLSLAFPDSTVTFLADATHSDLVRAALTKEAPGISVSWRTIQLPDRSLTPYERFRREKELVLEAYRAARDTGAALVVFSSITDTGLVAAKLPLLRSRTRIPVLIVFHNVLTGLEDRSRMLVKWRGISLALRLPHPRTLQYIVLGNPIQKYLAQHHPAVAVRCRPIELPYFWQEHSVPPARVSGSVRFGFFGVSAVPGFDAVVRIARTLQSEGSPAAFSMVGHLNHQPGTLTECTVVPDAERRVLSAAEYAERGRQLTYALWTTRSHRSGLVASTSFLDALSFVKPLVYLRNPLIDAYAETMGDIGYACADEGEMLNVVRSLAADWPEERYRVQCSTILAGRRMFEPHVVAESLHTIVEDLRGGM